VDFQTETSDAINKVIVNQDKKPEIGAHCGFASGVDKRVQDIVVQFKNSAKHPIHKYGI
jgi:hypothetical protein